MKLDVGETKERQEEAEQQMEEMRQHIKDAMGGLAERVRSVADLASAAAMPEELLQEALHSYVEEYKDSLDVPAVISPADNSVVLTLKDRESMIRMVRKNMDDRLITSRKSVTPTPTPPAPSPGQLVPVEEPPPRPEPLPAIEGPSIDREDFIEQVLKIQKLENDLHSKGEKIVELDRNVKALMQDSGRHLDRVKSKVKHLEREVTEIRIEQSKKVMGRVLSDTSTRNDAVSMVRTGRLSTKFLFALSSKPVLRTVLTSELAPVISVFDHHKTYTFLNLSTLVFYCLFLLFFY